MKLGHHRVYYARMWGGSARERELDEQIPKDEGDELIRLLFIQGLGGTHANWLQQLEFFAKDPRFDIVSLDCRGVGLSDTPVGRWRTTDIAQDVIALLEELKWQTCHCFGFSLGGMVSLEAALHRPDLFKSVTLISTHAGGLLGTLLPPWGILPFLRTFGNLGSVSALDRGMELLLPTQYLDCEVEDVHEELGNVASTVLGSNDRVTNRFKTAHELIQQGRKYIESGNGPEIRLEGTLKQITAALTHHVGWDRLYYLKVSGISFLVIAGKQDNLVNYINAGMLADALSASLILKEDAGHGVNLHYREEINNSLLLHVEKAEMKTVVEGRRPLSPKSGFPPSTHPWMTAIMSSFPAYVLARRLTSSRGRRFLIIIAFVSLILRLTHGPIYRNRQ